MNHTCLEREFQLQLSLLKKFSFFYIIVMDIAELRALNLTLLIFGMGHYATHIVTTVDGGEQGLLVALELNAPPNDLNHLEAELNATLVDYGFYITNIVQDARVEPVHVFCQVIFLHRRNE